MSKDRFFELRRCLHITNPATYEHNDREHPEYDKMRQVRWLVSHIRDACMTSWVLGKFVIVDEMMVWYERTYCPAQQYMFKKPQKWGIKIWCLANSVSKFIYNFDIYCGRNLGNARGVGRGRQDTIVAHEVVTKLSIGLENVEHCITMDNYFTSIPLLVEPASRGIYGIGIVRTNRVGLPSHLKNARAFKRVPHGHMEWAMHDSCEVYCVKWKDKCPILLLFIHSTPIRAPCEVMDTIPRRHGGVRNKIFTSPVLVEYTKYMWGVDVADQLRASYSCETWSHKWWHRMFWFLVDISIVNIFIMYLHICRMATNPVTPKSHLEFKTKLCVEFHRNWEHCQERQNRNLENRPVIHMPSWTAVCCMCVVCRSIVHTFCFQCNETFTLCWRCGCYEQYHTRR